MKQHLVPDPNPIPPEMPSDPSRSPAPDMPINVPPEKGPGQPEPMPPGPSRPSPVARAWVTSAFVAALVVSGPALAQRPAGKDTSELERPNPQQSACSQIGDAQERQRCLQRHQGSGAPQGKPEEARQAPPTGPGVGREMRPAPSGEARTPADPNRPASSR
jgi:hypothetical protein